MLKNILFIVVLVVLFIPFNVSAQVQVNEEAEVSMMMRNFISKHKSKESIRGWRIQIITTDNRRQMEAARSKFSRLYPDIPLKWKHESPYYKVQVGAYENKLNLQGFLLDLKNDFSTAIPVLDNVMKSELVSN